MCSVACYRGTMLATWGGSSATLVLRRLCAHELARRSRVDTNTGTHAQTLSNREIAQRGRLACGLARPSARSRIDLPQCEIR